MSKQTPNQEIHDQIIQMPLEEVMPTSIMPYAEHVILERALPRVEDGLKPVQRRILFTMQELGLTPDKPHRKCARIVGDCLGKYHPHGDSSVYDALTRMAQPYSLQGVLVDGHGNFGSIDGDSAAAMRYTEARMAPLATEMLRDIDKDTVPFRLNFDDTLKEPDLLPARYPNLLVNGSSGIAVGLATNIPPHNLKEAIQAACLVIDNENVSTDELMAVMPAPDFPTGGVLIDTPELRAAYETGKGKLTLRARVSIEKGSAGRTLIVMSEIPYGISKAQMLEKILRLSEEKKAQLSCIYDIRDESDREGMRAVVELRKDADVENTLACLYKYSDMQITFGVNMFAIADGKPQLMGIKTILQYFIRHQKDVVRRRTIYELDQAKARAHILEGLIVAVDHLDEVIALIRASKSGKEAKEKLMARFSFTDVQAQAILDLRLQRLTGLEILALRKEYADILKLITELEGILASEKKLLAVIKKELKEIAEKYGDERRTTLAGAEEIKEFKPIEEKPLAEESAVVLTNDGLLRRYFLKNFEKMERPASEKEQAKFLFRTDTAHTLLFFTDKGNMFPLSVGALAECRPRERGVSLSGVLAGLSADEKCVRLMCVDPSAFPQSGDLVFITKSGMIKRTKAEEYAAKRSKIAAISLKGEDKLVDVLQLSGDNDLLLVSRQGNGLRMKLDDIPSVGRAAAGVHGIRLDEKDEALFGAQLGNRDEIILISERGYGKRLPGAMFDVQKRGGKGSKCLPFAKGGLSGTYIAGILCLSQPQEISIYQKNSGENRLSSEMFPVAGLQDKGKPIVVAIMDDIVTRLQ